MSKLNSITLRLIVLFVSVFVLITVLFLCFIQSSASSFQAQSNQSLHSKLASHMIMDNKLLSKGNIDPEVLEHTFHGLMLLGPSFEIYVVDPDGKVIAFSAPQDKVKRTHVSLDPIHTFIDKQGSYPLKGNDPRNSEGDKIFSAAPIYKNEQLQGYLYVIIGSQLEENIVALLKDQRMISDQQAVFIASILFALLICLILIGQIVKPISHITRQVGRYERSNDWQQGKHIGLLPLKSQILPSKEETQLASAIEQMSVTMTEQFDQIVRKDIQRKELLSYISHDLRTPLASLIGYIETWQRQNNEAVQPANSEYIDTALKNAHVLNELVGQVFDLAHLETGGVELHREPLAIVELAQDIMETFKLQAKDAGVSLDFTPKDSTIWVDADIAKLERVFSNLVANAIRHTPAGGEIVITFVPIDIDNDKRVLIQVTDSGSGIPKDQLPRVFEAHFRAGNKRDSESGNAGLGLAIVKALLALHKTSIAVKSEEHNGTCFEFSLPLYQRK